MHAIRPLFPGREALVAAAFGLIHGLAFSETLRELNLKGAQLVWSLLGFNLGIGAMQLIIVAVVLPPLIVLARSGRYPTLRVVAATATAIAAAGWLAAGLDQPNAVADIADRLGILAGPVVMILWVAAAATIATARRQAQAIPPSTTSQAIATGKPAPIPVVGKSGQIAVNSMPDAIK